MPNKDLVENNSLTLKIRVRYQECDQQGVVFNARYGDYADLADTEYFRHLVGDFKSFNKSGYDKQVIHYEISWSSPAYFDDFLHLSASVSHVGNTSYKVKIDCSKETDNGFDSVATIHVTYVIVDSSSYKKTLIPDVLLDAFKKQFRKVIDQTGRTG